EIRIHHPSPRRARDQALRRLPHRAGERVVGLFRRALRRRLYPIHQDEGPRVLPLRRRAPLLPRQSRRRRRSTRQTWRRGLSPRARRAPAPRHLRRPAQPLPGAHHRERAPARTCARARARAFGLICNGISPRSA
ncbi:hypothetical protein OF83DRAFT_1197489, partial [Amylostereum chailletii]